VGDVWGRESSLRGCCCCVNRCFGALYETHIVAPRTEQFALRDKLLLSSPENQKQVQEHFAHATPPPLEPYSRTMPGLYGGPRGGAFFSMREVPL